MITTEVAVWEVGPMLERLAAALPGVLRNNPGLGDRARRALLTIHVSAGPATATVQLDNGQIAVEAGAKGNPDVTLIATTEAWASYADASPPVGFQSLNAMMRAGFLKARGNMLEFARHLLLIEELFASVRPEAGHAVSASKPVIKPVGRPHVEDIVGRYMRLDLMGRPHRIYFEEVGPRDGVPLLCLHTAGSDGRQWRGILNDAEVTRTFRVIAFDLPRHGKSSPPAGFEREYYQLTTDLYVATVMAVVDALGLARPVVIGCSIGGRVVLHLALRHGTHFRAAIGLQSALVADPGRDSILRDLGIIWRPDVHGGDAAAATVACLIGPHAPSADRWETLWHYSQSGPGVFSGDLHYYSEDGNLGANEVSPLASGPCPIYLLTGEYDLSATPALTAELARLIKPCHFEVMRGLGHFPMSEDPQLFLGYLRPILERIARDA
jgi:pimeloyl-ACP methyl ester carboxylesterase